MINPQLNNGVLATRPQPLLDQHINAVQQLGYWPVKIAFALIPHNTRLELQLSDLKPGQTYVIAANHQSILDPFVIISSLPMPIWSRLKTFRFMAYNALFESPLLRAGLLSLGSFPASHHPSLEAGLDAAKKFVAYNRTVVIFPQGRRRAEKGRARSGVKVLADLPGVNIIPAHIQWQGKGWRKSYRLVIGHPFAAARSSAQGILDHIYTLDT